MAFVYNKLRRVELERNIWNFSIRRATLYPVSVATMALVPAAWSSTPVYQAGQVVSYTDSYGHTQNWYSRANGNVGVTPETPGSLWQPYFGPMLVNQFMPQSGQVTPYAYRSGDVIYLPSGLGSNPLFLSLYDNNTDVPNVVETWLAYVNPFLSGVLQPQLLTTTGRIQGQYNRGDIVVGPTSGYLYMSLIDVNQNNTPEDSALPWNQFTTYAAGAQVCGSNGMLYASQGSSNTGNNPVTDSGTNWQNMQTPVPWTTSFSPQPSSLLWTPLDATLQAPNINYPVGAGPIEQTYNDNVFPLPNNFIRRANQSPKAGVFSFLGAPSGLMADDWVIERPFLTSRTPNPIVLRFAADITDVTLMSGQFCEALAARIAMETCEELTQAEDKLTKAENHYSVFIRDARLTNAIENGPDAVPVDDLIVCRL